VEVEYEWFVSWRKVYRNWVGLWFFSFQFDVGFNLVRLGLGRLILMGMVYNVSAYTFFLSSWLLNLTMYGPFRPH